jgi:hypothetical protein
MVFKFKALYIFGLCHSAVAAVYFRFSNALHLGVFLSVANVGCCGCYFVSCLRHGILRIFCGFSQPCQTNAWKVLQNRPRPLSPVFL